AVHSGHGVVDDEEIKGSASGENTACRFWSVRLMHAVSHLAENLAHQHAHIGIVVAEQDMPPSMKVSKGLPRNARRESGWCVGTGEPDLDGRALAELASHRDRAPGLSGKAMDHSQPEARPDTNTLGREEGFDRA